MVSSFATMQARIRSLAISSVVILFGFTALGVYALHEAGASATGSGNCTQKVGSTNGGCSCHCPAASPATSVTVTTSATTFYTSGTYTFTVTVANSAPVETGAGVDIATQNGALHAGTGLKLVTANGSELVNSSTQAFSSGQASWTFTYTAPSVAGFDTIFATGCSVNGDAAAGGTCTDQWNNAAKFIIQVQTAPVATRRFSISRNLVDLGKVRVGISKSDSVLLTSTGNSAITINSNIVQHGLPFLIWTPAPAPRTLAASGSSGSSEIDSVIFRPSERGAVKDSIVYTTNSDTIPNQSKTIVVQAQGVQAIFGGSNTPIDFGPLAMGSSNQRSFLYSNTGDDTLFGNASIVGSSYFTIIQGPTHAALAPGERDSVVVKYAPGAVGQFTASLKFSAMNGVSAPSVALSGSGYDPESKLTFVNYQGITPVRVATSQNIRVLFQSVGKDSIHVTSVKILQSKAKKFALIRYDTSVAGYSTGAFTVQYSPTLEGIDTASIAFATDDHLRPFDTVNFYSQGILPHMSLGRHDTIDMGTIEAYQTTTRHIVIMDTGGDNLSIINASVSPQPFGLVNFSGLFIPAHLQDYLTVSFSPDTLGQFTGMFVVASDDPNRPTDSIALKGTAIKSFVSIDKPSIDFGSVGLKNTVYDTVTLTNTEGDAISILSAQLAADSDVFSILQLDSTISNAAPAKIVVSFTPTSTVAYSGEITLTTTDASAPTRTISLSGVGVQGMLTITPNPQIFGIVTVGKDTTLMMSLRNTGSAPVRVVSINVVSLDSTFTYSPITVPLTFAPNDSAMVSITFAPQMPIPDTASFIVTLDDGTSQSATLGGFGVTPPPPPPPESVNEDTRSFTVFVYPNPTSRHFMIGGKFERYELTDLLGEIRAEGRSNDVEVASLANGVYYLRMIVNNQIEIHRIVIAH